MGTSPERKVYFRKRFRVQTNDQDEIQLDASVLRGYRMKLALLNAGALLIVSLSTGVVGAQVPDAEKAPPLRALLIGGGCCHDYPAQIQIITEGISQRAHVAWEVFHGATGRDREIIVYQTDDWTHGFDVVVHNECSRAVEDVEFVDRIVRGHTLHGVPAVVIHCSVHSYRNAATDEWRKLLGVTSRRHEKGGRQLDVVNRAQDHPIMRGFPGSWKTPNGELYVIEKSWLECQVLGTAYGVETKIDHPVIWTNRYQNTRVFGTTLGHHNETMIADKWLDVVSRGVLWVCDQLQQDGTPASGYAGTGIAAIKDSN